MTERTQSSAAAYAAWSAGATLVGLAGDLLQPLGAIALVLLFVCGAATLLTFALSLVPALRRPMGTASTFFLIGTFVFGVIVGLQYSASGGEGGARGFVAANVPAVATLQARVLQQADAASQPGETAPTSAQTTTPAATSETPETMTGTATTLQPLPQSEPGVVRSGAFAARVERMALFWEADRADRYEVTATVTLSLHNLSDRPVSVAVISDNSISLALDNGYTLGGSYAVVSMNQCRRDECRYENLTRIEPGASVVLNMTLRTEADGSWAAVTQAQLPAMTRTQTASFSARLLLADDWAGADRPANVPDQAGARVVQLGFANVPISTPTGGR